MTATVLMVKRYPAEEFAVILDTSPAVFTLRDVQYFYPRANNLIQEGSRIMMHTIGYWNVHTSAMHHSNISVWYDKPTADTRDNTQDKNKNPPVTAEPSKCDVQQPPLRKRRVAMEF
jgi:hypothetical protein